MKIVYPISMSIALTILATGCGDDSSSTPTPASTNSTTSSGYLGAVGQAKTFSEKQIDLAYVKQGIQMFQASEGHYPKTLQDLVPNYIGKVPVAPAGYKISYDSTTGEVKVEKQ